VASPVARRLRINRASRRQVRLVGVRHDGGLNRAAASSEYSCVKYAPEQQGALSEQSVPGSPPWLQLFEAAFEELARLRVAVSEFGLHLRQERAYFRLGKCRDSPANHLGARVVRQIQGAGPAPDPGPDAA